MKGKKESKLGNKAEKNQAAPGEEGFGQISNKEDLKGFLVGVRDKMAEQMAAPIHALSAMNLVLNSPQIYEWLDNENKEVARDIWLRLRQSGMQLRNPPMLFGADEEDLAPQAG